MPAEKAARLREHMERFFPDAMVTDYEHLIDAMPNDPKDRHVAAAAVQASAQLIVTSNLKDFRALPDGVEAQSPDEFLCSLFDLDSEGFVQLLREQAGDLRRPAVSFEQLLSRLGRIVPEFAATIGEATGDQDR